MKSHEGASMLNEPASLLCILSWDGDQYIFLISSIAGVCVVRLIVDQNRLLSRPWR